MSVSRSIVALAVLLLSCAEEASPQLIADCSTRACSRYRSELRSSFLTLRRPWGAEADAATWRFLLDERECTLTPTTGTTSSQPAGATVTCALRDEADDGTVPLFVGAEMVPGGFGRTFRIDTMARAVSHVRIERDAVLVDQFDHAPTPASGPSCESFGLDTHRERELPPIAEVP
jgi:hypothetical protein